MIKKVQPEAVVIFSYISSIYGLWILKVLEIL
jgi:hypothetical protein